MLLLVHPLNQSFQAASLPSVPLHQKSRQRMQRAGAPAQRKEDNGKV